jgi:hypothetical protein
VVLLISALVVAAAVIWGARAIAREVARTREGSATPLTFQILRLFTPGLAAGADNVRALLVWEPLARTSRRLFPSEFEALDRAAGSTFPFSKDRIQAAHAQWTTEWLAWERAHDEEYKLKAAKMRDGLASGDQVLTRSSLEAVEREKLDLYQRRYEEYVRVAKALQALIE